MDASHIEEGSAVDVELARRVATLLGQISRPEGAARPPYPPCAKGCNANLIWIGANKCCITDAARTNLLLVTLFPIVDGGMTRRFDKV